MSYTIEQVKERRTQAYVWKLSGRELLDDYVSATLVCNGIGAEWMPSWMRTLLGGMFPHLVLAADIHDLRYYIGGNINDRRNADAEFLANCMVIAESAYRWYDPRRYAAKSLANKMYSILRVAGSLAWNHNGGEKNNEDEN